MNKIFKLLFFVFVVFVISGCTSNTGGTEPSTHQHTPCQKCGLCLDLACDDLEARCKGHEDDDVREFVQSASEDIVIPSTLTSSINLNYSLKKDNKVIEIMWDIDKTNSISELGRVNRSYNDEKVKLTATFSYSGVEYQKEYTTVVLGYTFEERVELIKKEITISNLVDGDIELPTKFNDPDAVVTWESSNQDVLTNDGKYTEPSEIVNFDLVLTIIINGVVEEIVYNMQTFKAEIMHHLNVNYATDYDLTNNANLMLDGNYLTLQDGVLTSEYESKVYETLPFVSMVGSWTATTSTKATVEVLYKVRVNGVWSAYLSYGEWGLGLQNKCYSTKTSDGLAKMSTDEIMINNGNTANAYQFKVILKRDTLAETAPKVLLVAASFEFENYTFPVSTNSLPTYYCHDVPMLNQNIVPVIGNSICSATSTTMLLKYKGHSFTEYDAEFEHRYIAGLVKDYNHDIFGNWVYNVAVLGSYGNEAYLLRMYSLEELVYHLATVGPISASVKGNMQGYYTTNGHLIVVKGYEYVNGELQFICNDPNLKNVEVRYSAETMQNVWRNMAYVIK